MTAKEKFNHKFIKLTWKVYLFSALLQLMLVIWYGDPISLVIFMVFYAASLFYFDSDLKMREAGMVQ